MKLTVFIYFAFLAYLTKAEENESCEISGTETGICIPAQNCEGVSVQQLRKLSCGFSGNVPLVCCSIETTTMDLQSRLENFDSCTTPNAAYESDGFCTPFKKCGALMELTKSKPISQQNAALLRESDKLCDDYDSKKYVCCPLPVTTTSSTTTTTTQRATTEFPGNKPCQDARMNKGSCLRPKECPHVWKMLNNKPIAPKARNFLMNSQCGFHDKIPYVCCAHQEETTTTTEKITTEIIEEATTTSLIKKDEDWLIRLKSFLPSAPDCGFEVDDRIFGGEETEIEEHIWTVLLEYEKPNKTTGLHCGGSLINERYVLTAAHCVKKIPESWKLTNVRIGDWDTTTSQDCNPDDEDHCLPSFITNKIVETKVYKDYRQNSKSQQFDIALLRLAKKINFNGVIKPLCLPLDRLLWKKDYSEHAFVSAGWGRTENGTQSNRKLKVTLPFYQHGRCKTVYSRAGRPVTDDQICAGGEKGRDTCKGDSGGPLMEKNVETDPPYWYLVGIVSYGAEKCGAEKIPGVYTRVSSFLEWISENIRK